MLGYTGALLFCCVLPAAALMHCASQNVKSLNQIFAIGTKVSVGQSPVRPCCCAQLSRAVCKCDSYYNKFFVNDQLVVSFCTRLESKTRTGAAQYSHIYRQ